MTIKEFLKQDVDMDVIDDYSDDLWIAFCGPMELTPAGVKRYGAVLDLPVEFRYRPGWGDTAAVVLLNDNPDCERLERKCIDLFESLAGYCTEKQFYARFREVEPEQ